MLKVFKENEQSELEEQGIFKRALELWLNAKLHMCRMTELLQRTASGFFFFLFSFELNKNSRDYIVLRNIGFLTRQNTSTINYS